MIEESERKSRFPIGLYWIVLGMLLGTAGINIAIILLGLKYKWDSIFFVHLVIFYWILVSALIVLYIKHKIHKTYEIPLQEISKATEKVSKGDFTVSVPTVNPP